LNRSLPGLATDQPESHLGWVPRAGPRQQGQAQTGP
jgi:hypothetical protein